MRRPAVLHYIGPAAFVLLTAAMGLVQAQGTGPVGKVFRNLLLDKWQFRTCQLGHLVVADCQVRDANVSQARLTSSKVVDSRVSACEVSGLRLENVRARDLSAYHCQFQGLKAENADIRSIHLRNSDLRDIRFERLDIYGGLGGLSDWTVWKSIRFYQNDFNDFAFDYCDFYHGRFERCDIRDTSFRWCDFSYVELRGCDIRGMTIDGVSVEKAIEEYKKNH